MKKSVEFLAADLQDIIEKLSSCGSEDRHRSLLHSLALADPSGSVRVLSQLWSQLPWRQTQGIIFEALALTQDMRGIEFIFRVLRQSQDLGMQSQALHALRLSRLPLVAFYLRSRIDDPKLPLLRQSLESLRCFPLYPWQPEVQKIAGDRERPIPHRVAAILALGAQGSPQFYKDLLEQDPDDELRGAIYMALSQLPDTSAHSILSLEIPDDQLLRAMRDLALEQTEKRRYLTIEDAVGEFLETEAHESVKGATALAWFAPDEAWEAFQILATSGSLEHEALARAITYHPDRHQEDLDFLKEHRESLDHESWLWLCSRLETVDVPIDWLIESPTPKAVDRLEKHLIDPGVGDAEKISCINALVHCRWLTPEQYSSSLIDLVGSAKGPVANRALRACGQLGIPLPSLGKLSQRKNIERSSYWAYLNMLPANKEIGDLAVKNLAAEGLADNKSDPEPVLNALLQHPTSKPLNLDGLDLGEYGLLLLNVFRSHSSPQAAELITLSLGSDSYLEQLSALAATKRNPVADLWSRLQGFLHEDSRSLCIRALDTLLHAGTPKDHEKVFEWASQHRDDPEIMHKLLYDLQPRRKGYQKVQEIVETWVSSSWPQQGETLQESALSLLQKLRYLDCPETLPQASTQTLDRSLQQVVKGFPQLPANVQATLRSGYLPWEYPDIYAGPIDKSTSIIQLSKALDLLLQERLGQRIFFTHRDPLLRQMRSRILELGLDESYLNFQRTSELLQCRQQFDERSFPMHRLKTIAASIVSGKIEHDEYRVIDGLRAWSILLLLFSQNLRLNGKKLPPIVPPRKDTGVVVADVAAALNALQELRNQAAHRGVFSDVSALEQFRLRSLTLLEQLGCLWPPKEK